MILHDQLLIFVILQVKPILCHCQLHKKKVDKLQTRFHPLPSINCHLNLNRNVTLIYHGVFVTSYRYIYKK